MPVHGHRSIRKAYTTPTRPGKITSKNGLPEGKRLIYLGSSWKSVGKLRPSIGLKGAWMLGLGAVEGREKLA